MHNKCVVHLNLLVKEQFVLIQMGQESDAHLSLLVLVPFVPIHMETKQGLLLNLLGLDGYIAITMGIQPDLVPNHLALAQYTEIVMVPKLGVRRSLLAQVLFALIQTVQERVAHLNLLAKEQFVDPIDYLIFSVQIFSRC